MRKNCEQNIHLLQRKADNYRLENRKRNHLHPITGGSGETGWRPPCLRSPTDVTFPGLSPSLVSPAYLVLISFPHKLEAKPQELHEELKMAPMITATDSFVDPGSQTADQIARIYRALEVSLAHKRSIQSL